MDIANEYFTLLGGISVVLVARSVAMGASGSKGDTDEDEIWDIAQNFIEVCHEPLNGQTDRLN